MLANVKRRIEADKLFQAGDSIVVGVSGGVDSTALLHILWRLNQQYDYGWKLFAVHLDHGFRGEESAEDARFVKAYCESLGVECRLFERNVSLYMKETGLGAQEASRVIRYDLFCQVAEQVGASKVAVAHHADDQVETVVFRLIRGTGMQGLAGMPVRRWLVPDKVELVRPLLGIYREELEQYCRENGLAVREDSSNQTRKYKRNKLRLDILPQFASINPRYREHILQLAESARIDHAYLQAESERALQQVIARREPNHVVIDGKKFQTCDLALQRRMITLILSYLSCTKEWSSQHVEAVLQLIGGDNPSAEIQLSDCITVRRVYQYITFVSGEEQASNTASFCCRLIVPGITRIAEADVTIRAERLSTAPDWQLLTAAEAVFDEDLLGDCLFVRNRRKGDRIRPFGTKGSKKVKDLLIDAKVPKSLRDKLPIVATEREILWVPGIRRSLLAPVTEKTSKYVLLQAEFGEVWREVF